MKGPLVFLAVVACAIAVAGDDPIKRAIERQYKRWAAAYVVNDVDTILAILAPDYSLTTFAGKTIPLKDYAVSLKAKKASGKKNAAYKTRIKKLDAKRDTASVVSEEVSVTVATDPVTNTKQRLVHVHEYLDTWVRKGKAWRLRSTVTTLEKTTVVKQ